MSATPDSTLADPEQRIADLERQLAEGLEQQTATAEVLQVINSSPGDLAPVFEAMLEKAMQLCEAEFGILNTYDGENFHRAAARGVPPAFEEWRLRQGPMPSGPGTLYGRITSGEKNVLHTLDLMAEDSYRDGDRDRRAFVELAGARTALVVALRKEGTLLGTITIFRQEVRPFTDKQIALLQNFASQAVIAMENARLITETREALEQQTATAEVLQVINSSPGDLAPVFDAILQKAHTLCGVDRGTLQLCDGEYFRAVATHGLPDAVAASAREPYRPAPSELRAQLLAGAPYAQSADLAESEGYRSGAPSAKLVVDIGGTRSVLWVPLRKDGVLLGAISAARTEVKPFSDKEIALLENFAAQAVIAMENARLITETREALEQQTATSEVLQVINSSPGDLGPVFDAILEKAHDLCGAVYGSLHVAEGEEFCLVAIRGMPEAFVARIQRIRPGPHHPVRRLLAGAPYAMLSDQTDHDDPIIQDALKLADMRAALWVPLRKDGVMLGYIVASRKEARPFTEKQIALLQNFAAQAVIAMENARLITETREALEQQTATAEVLGVINSSPGDLAPVFDAILEKAHSLCGVASGSLQLYDGQLFRAVAVHGMPEPLADLLRQPYAPEPGSASDHLLAGDAFYQIADLAQAVTQASAANPRNRLAVELNGVRTLLFVPLRKDDALLGLITAARQEMRPFTDKQIALLQNFAAEAVIAMENARLVGELRQRTDEVGALNRDLEARVAAQVDELSRVGRLKRFLAPQLAELIVSHGDEKILESHRREIVVVFCDLRGYTAFTETAEPEEVLDFLREYHGALGPLVSQFEGTLDQFSGDGIMVFFNDPVPCPDPAERAVNMAVAMRSAANTLIADWRERGRDLGFGAGIAQGYATLGQIGFSERSGYTAIGTVCNVAARLCAEAKDGQILLGQRVNVALKGSVATEQLGPLALKGLSQPVVAYNVPLAASQPALRVIEGGPQSV